MRYVCLGLLACSGLGWSATPYPRLVKDINRVPYVGHIGVHEMVEAQGRLFFSAESEDFGKELWISDGSAKGTRMLKDLAPGRAGSNLQDLKPMGGNVYFSAYHNGGGGLWKSDGTADGTVLVKDMTSIGGLHSGPVAASASKVWFMAESWDGTERGLTSLWASDGTEAGTLELNPLVSSGEEEPAVRAFHVDYLSAPPAMLGGNYYFGANGGQLWRSDGTAAGSVPIADLTGGDGARIVSLVATTGRWFAICRNGPEDFSLWTGNGEPGSAQELEVAPSWIDALNLRVMGDKVYFHVLRTAANGELWCSDGTAAGTLPLANALWPEIAVSGANLYFNGGTLGTGELWKTDGTVAGTALVKEIRPGAVGAEIQSLTAAPDGVYFAADDGVHGSELWFSDGTAAGTRMIFESLPGTAAGGGWNPVWALGRLFFSFSDGDPLGLWVSKGRQAAKRISPDQRTTRWGISPYFAEAVANGRKLFFRADDGVHGEELWVSNGTKQGTRLVADLGEADGIESVPHFMTPHGDGILFVATDKDGHEDVWYSDGTRKGTKALTDFKAPPVQTVPHSFVRQGETSYFVSPGTTDRRLWQTDGTPEGTTEVAGLFTDKVEPELALVGNKLFFAERVPPGSIELQALENGVNSSLKFIPVSQNPLQVSHFTAVDGRLAFFVTGNSGYDLWTSDGTEQGTNLVRAGLQGVTWSGTVDGVHVFTAHVFGLGLRYWRSDGTPAGTKVLTDLVPVSGDYDSVVPVVAGGFLYFVATDASFVRRLWKTDGTPQGTVPVTDPDLSVDAQPGTLASTGDRIYFSADGGDGWQLWTSDGTPGGTVRVPTRGRPGSDPFPTMLTPADHRLFYGAFAPGKGLELHLLKLPRH